MRAHEHLDALAEAERLSGAHPAEWLMLGLAVAFGIWLAVDSLRPAPVCAVPVPATEIRPTEQRT